MRNDDQIVLHKNMAELLVNNPDIPEYQQVDLPQNENFVDVDESTYLPALFLQTQKSRLWVKLKPPSGSTEPEFRYLRVAISDIMGQTRFMKKMIQIGDDAELMRIQTILLMAHKFRSGLAQNIPIPLLQLFLSEVSGILHTYVLDQGVEKLGNAPCAFTFIVLGSEGRCEQTLKTDQDNAIIYEKDDENKSHQEYFLKLGSFVNKKLDSYGFELCRGEIMAGNAKWCASLDTWKKYFSTWVKTPQPMAVMQSTIFFDFRNAYGQNEPGYRLRHHLSEIIAGRSDLFFFHLAQNALDSAVPLGLFGGFKRERNGTMDIKKAMLPPVNMARIWALKHGILHTSTLGRLWALSQKAVIKTTEYEEMSEYYKALMQYRIEQQLHRIIDLNRPPNNHFDPTDLPKADQQIMKDAFKKFKELQLRIRFEFRAGY
ncbi:MAG: DUF294 nucleotidyltransferase-like domain-containing protein [Balneolales bacterium]|nr:DUF294 nucleotidyltransferase-like domain-containing protein [Balneolales bacterium]